MNYEKVYYQIIERAGDRRVDGYVEWHHIVPKCMGGDDSRDNLVPLTAREHLLCHLLLTEIYPEHIGLARAAFLMSTYRKVKVSARTYQELRERIVPWNKGKSGTFKHTEESKRKLSIAAKGKPQSKESNLKRSKSKKGYITPQETKDKISKTKTGKVGALKGRKQKTVQCPHCSKSGGVSNMTRHHFDKCKKKVDS